MSGYISCVTISSNDQEGLFSTLDSVDAQSEQPYEHIVIVSNTPQIDEIIKRYSKKYRFFFVDQDTSLYNAMNIGVAKAKGMGIYFLNGGDVFYHRRSLETLNHAFKRGICLCSKVAMVYRDVALIRPGAARVFELLSSPPHQGFVAPLETEPDLRLFFDEMQIVSADSKWIKENIDRYSCIALDCITAKFALGGVSNNPSFRLLIAQFKAKGWVEASKVSVKIMAKLLLGARGFYRLIGKWNGYDSI